MEIARLTAICRKTKCGPLENDIARLRAQIATLEKRNADLEEGRGNFESEYALMEKQLASKGAELEAAETELEESKLLVMNSKFARDELEIEILVMKSKLASPPSPPPCEDCRDYKELDDLNNHERDERAQQDIEQKHRIIDLEFEIQLLRDEMAMMAMEGSVAGFGGDLSPEEQAYQQAKQQHSS